MCRFADDFDCRPHGLGICNAPMRISILNSVNSSCLNFASESYPPVVRGMWGQARAQEMM